LAIPRLLIGDKLVVGIDNALVTINSRIVASLDQPGKRMGNLPTNDVREQSIGRHGAILQHPLM
jgi:hypothetical protein